MSNPPFISYRDMSEKDISPNVAGSSRRFKGNASIQSPEQAEIERSNSIGRSCHGAVGFVRRTHSWSRIIPCRQHSLSGTRKCRFTSAHLPVTSETKSVGLVEVVFATVPLSMIDARAVREPRVFPWSSTPAVAGVHCRHYVRLGEFSNLWRGTPSGVARHGESATQQLRSWQR
jgi:hypothetical protein